MSVLQIFEFNSFIQQVGFIFSGAAVLWGWIFIHQALRRDTAEQNLLRQLSNVMLPVYLVGSIVIIGSLVYNFLLVQDSLTFIALLLLLATWIVGFYMQRIEHKKRPEVFEWFFAIAVTCVLIISIFPFLESESTTGLYEVMHALLRVSTLGTAFIATILFFVTHRLSSARGFLVKELKFMCRAVWLGIILDLVALWIFVGSPIFSEEFFFSQVALGVAIVAFAIFYGPLLDILREQVDAKRFPSFSIGLLMQVCCGVAVSAWLASLFVETRINSDLTISNASANLLIFELSIVVFTVLLNVTLKKFRKV